MVEERWMNKAILLNFFNALNEIAEKKHVCLTLNLFGGGALVLHNLREMTSDIDSILLVNGKVYSNFFDNIKYPVLNTIGITKDSPLINNTFNDISVLAKAVQDRAVRELDANQESYNFHVIEMSALTIKFPSKEFLLANRLIDLILPNPKSHLDLIDANCLLKDLNICQKNKAIFLENVKNHRRFTDIGFSLDSILNTTDHISVIQQKMHNIRMQNLEIPTTLQSQRIKG